MEAEKILPYSIKKVLNLPPAFRSLMANMYPTTKATIKAWRVLYTKINPFTTWSRATPLSVLRPALPDLDVEYWLSHSVVHINDLFLSNSFLSFDQLQAKFSLDASVAPMHRQMVNLLSEHFKVSDRDLGERKVSMFNLENIYLSDSNRRQTISICYAYFTGELGPKLDCMTKWERELNIKFTIEEWHGLLLALRSIT
ncbi:Hypothetical predicted protein [Pelobates cultripes]|uniref:Uncharacterized protein n=1 Tax=Pelobates cultripes TaxID=61616 RepID=A0AAD1VTR3_PELCU|nr:Hypothetical predicted protein [Pelobates cultripes]